MAKITNNVTIQNITYLGEQRHGFSLSHVFGVKYNFQNANPKKTSANTIAMGRKNAN